MSQNWTPPPPAAAGTQANVPNNMVIAIIATVFSLIFCCLPHGLISLIYALQVNKKAVAGDVAGAEAASRSARMWGLISIVLAIISLILGIILSLTGAVNYNFTTGGTTS